MGSGSHIYRENGKSIVEECSQTQRFDSLSLSLGLRERVRRLSLNLDLYCFYRFCVILKCDRLYKNVLYLFHDYWFENFNIVIILKKFRHMCRYR